MKANFKKVISLVALVAILLTTTIATPAYASERMDYDIKTLDEFTEAVHEASKDGTITSEEKEELLKETAPEIVEEYVNNKIAEAMDAAEDVPVVLDDTKDGVAYQKEVIDLGDGSNVVVEFFEGEDLSVLERIGEAIFGFLFDEVYAATNGECIWKDYGNRYFTAIHTYYIAPMGYATVKFENHYNVSSSGLTERYGISYVSTTQGYFTYSNTTDAVITDKTATRAGTSIGMYCKVTLGYSIPALAGVGASQTKIFRTSAQYVKHDTKSKQIQVKHAWTAS